VKSKKGVITAWRRIAADAPAADRHAMKPDGIAGCRHGTVVGCGDCGRRTSAVREAGNGEEFLAETARETGLTLRLIDGREEARLTLLGVQHGLRLGSRRVLAVDIGGGSTEFILAKGDVIEGVVSTGLGVVKLTERYLVNDPPTVDERRKLEEVAKTRSTASSRLPLPEQAQPSGPPEP
jgi:hypothetical protein